MSHAPHLPEAAVLCAEKQARQKPREQSRLTQHCFPCLGNSQICSPWMLTRSLPSAWTLILDWGRELPSKAASDGQHSWCLLVIWRAQFKLLLDSSIRLLIYGKAGFCSPCNSFPKRSTSTAGVKSAKQSPVTNPWWLWRGLNKAGRDLSLSHSAEEWC